MKTYILYSKEGCVYCQYARQLFDLHEIGYTELKLGKAFDSLADLGSLIPDNWRTFPVIAISHGDGILEFIGGYTELREHVEKNT